MKKSKRIRYKRRVVIYSSLVFLILFSIFDYYCETYGLPAFAEQMVYEKLQKRGFDLQFDDIKCGVINGIVLTDVRLKDSQWSLDDFLVADELKILFSPNLKSRYFLAPSAVEIVSGTLNIPLFPGSEESKSDVISLKNVNSRIEFNGNSLEILYLSGEISPFHFSCYGAFLNVFFPNMFNDVSFDAEKKHQRSFSIIPTIKSIAFESRASFYRKFLKLQSHDFFKTEQPECQVMVDIDALHPERSTMKADISSPPFEYEGFSIKSVNAQIAYVKNRAILKSLLLKFPHNSELSISGGWNNSDGLVSARVEGRLNSEEITGALNIFDIEIPKAFQITKPMPFKLNLENFSLDAKKSRGELTLSVPEVKFRDLNIYKVKTKLQFLGNRVSATNLYFETDSNIVRGDIDYNAAAKSVDASLHSFGAPLFLVDMMGDENTKMINTILSRFKFSPKKKDIELSADIHCSWGDEFFYFISGNMGMHSFEYLGMPFDRSQADIIIDSNEILIIPSITVEQGDSTATASMIYDASATFKCKVDAPLFNDPAEYKNQLLLNGKSSLPGDVVLKCIFSDWNSNMLDLSLPVNIVVAGSIDFSDNPVNSTDFNVKISDSMCKWYKLPVAHFSGDLSFKGLDMYIKNAYGKVYGGDLALYYHTNFDTEKGHVSVDLQNVDFVSIVKHIKWDLEGEGGLLSATTDADLAYDQQDNLLMTGLGTLKVRDANLWEVPIINSFGRLASPWLGNKWGVISDLDADFQFKESYVESKDIHTNGNVVALRGQGKYFWATGNFNFLVHAEVLKTVLPFKLMTKMFDPITGLMESRVVRKHGKISWEKISWNEKFFSK